jgi:RNA polymerase sigma-70 factor (ECF subfamily)
MPDSEHTSPGELPRRAQFEATSWTNLLAARQSGSPGAEAALEKLCRTYWYPLYAHVRRRGFDAAQAEDMTQEFFYRILKENFLGAADRTKGKFRSFLLASLDNFLNEQRRQAGAQKRGGGRVLLSLDAGDAEQRYLHEPTADLSPEKQFTRRWFLTLHEEVLARLQAEATAAGAGRAAQFERLKPFLTGDTGFGDYGQVAAELKLTPNAVAVAVHRLRTRCQELWREEIARTVASPEEVDGEIRHLRALFSA